jgi:prevent-host-death family protein
LALILELDDGGISVRRAARDARRAVLRFGYNTAMKFITMRELRNQTSQVIDELEDETGVITSNGEPVGILVRVNENFEETINVLRQARAAAAVSRLRRQALESGAGELSPEDIDAEIRKARRGRKG